VANLCGAPRRSGCVIRITRMRRNSTAPGVRYLSNNDESVTRTFRYPPNENRKIKTLADTIRFKYAMRLKKGEASVLLIEADEIGERRPSYGASRLRCCNRRDQSCATCARGYQRELHCWRIRGGDENPDGFQVEDGSKCAAIQ
jgi:hypothetical protein